MEDENIEKMEEILIMVADGKIIPRAVGETWDEVYAGKVYFFVDGHLIVVFNDCDSWDYIDLWFTPDGKEYNYDYFEKTIFPDEVIFEKYGTRIFDLMVSRFITAQKI